MSINRSRGDDSLQTHGIKTRGNTSHEYNENFSPVRPAVARTVSVALLGFDLNSNVKAGGNSGRSLRHDFVTLACQTKTLSTDKPENTASFDLPTAPEDAKRLALAVWLEEPGHAGIQQATGGWLTGGTPE